MHTYVIYINFNHGVYINFTWLLCFIWYTAETHVRRLSPGAVGCTYLALPMHLVGLVGLQHTEEHD